MKRLLILCLALSGAVAHAELKPVSDAALSNVVGQSGAIIELSGDITYDAIKYNGVVVSSASPAPNDIFKEDHNVTMTGSTVGLPSTGSLMDLFGMILPLTVGYVDTNGDGVADRGAAVLNFKPNLMTPFTPISITPGDTVLNFNDQTFVTKQGIVFLNSPTTSIPTVTVGGSSYQFVPVQKMF